MPDAARTVYDSLETWRALDALIDEGEAEGLHLECKTAQSARLNQDQKKTIAEAVSGFSNTEGGVIIWGISTSSRHHSGLDVLVQIEPIGGCQALANAVSIAVPTVTTPAVTNAETKVLRQQPRDKKGVAVTYIPKTLGDPVQDNLTGLFWFRSGASFVRLPYQMVQRMFQGTQSPDLIPQLLDKLATKNADGLWTIPISIGNESSAVARHAVFTVTLENPDSCANIRCNNLENISNINPGQTVFQGSANDIIHRGLPTKVGDIQVTMKPRLRVLRFTVDLFADRMRARSWSIRLELTQAACHSSGTFRRYAY